MSKIAVVYWSGTGNTEAMAKAVAEGAKSAGAEVELVMAPDFSTAALKSYDAVAFGCPAMGAEVLEENEFEPMFAALEGSLSGRRIALFGSYGWGDGQWMRDWCERCGNIGADLYDENGLIVNETPDDDALAECRSLGKALAG